MGIQDLVGDPRKGESSTGEKKPREKSRLEEASDFSGEFRFDISLIRIRIRIHIRIHKLYPSSTASCRSHEESLQTADPIDHIQAQTPQSHHRPTPHAVELVQLIHHAQQPRIDAKPLRFVLL